MYKKILIANRGEIAIRVMRACREMGIRTVAIYSEADARAFHTRYADEAYCVGPAPDNLSYLNIQAIIEVALKAHVDAVHPGYGFLSENPHFAAVCRTWGIDFIGPSAEAIERVGSKSLARQPMIQAGVPVIAGTPGTVGSPQAALETANNLGFPVVVKAAAGGGGRGIRIAHTPSDLEAVLESAQREAERYFGNKDVYIEKYLEDPRHIEVQIMADQLGNTIHLLERECSIQRRRQKIIEEAPSPFLNAQLREAICQAAVRAAKAVSYTNAGTIEFLVDRNGDFYFCEMNTRIQVEHPITELITGVDIVKEQIRIAAGEPLRFSQEGIKPRGWAIECRITAEDPSNRLMPSPGIITSHRPPGGPGVRLDGGFVDGDEVSPYYDSLISKLIVWGETREEAIIRMQRALDEYHIDGIKTIIPVLKNVLAHPDFQAGTYHTKFFEEEFLEVRA